MTGPDARCAVCLGRLLPEAQITGGPPRHEDANLESNHAAIPETREQRRLRLLADVDWLRDELVGTVRDAITQREDLDDGGRMTELIRPAFTALVAAEEQLDGGR